MEEVMGYFDDENNVQEYIKMAEGYDGRALIDALRNYVKPGATVLEIGMGPGKDLDILVEYFTVTGSDSSEVFIEHYRKKNMDADLLLLDAVTLETDRTFDCIYSNKVLHHLSEAELQESLKRQKDILNPGGILFHSFWEGDRTEEMHGLLFVYYRKDTLEKMVGKHFELIEIKGYSELEERDSIYIVAR
jgi:cyclopropane fatty-acyl-phospholipid synthase-like methyltransferase